MASNPGSPAQRLSAPWLSYSNMAAEEQDNNLAVSMAPMTIASPPRQPLCLMSLPGEVRSRIWNYLFVLDQPIPLVINSSGRITLVRSAKLALQSLPTSKDFYYETCPFVYGGNTFDLDFNNMVHLQKFAQKSRMCIIHCLVSLPVKPEDSENDMVDIGLIGQAMPYLKKLEITTQDPSQLLGNTLSISKSLPCSSVRDVWPLLEVYIQIPFKDLSLDFVWAQVSRADRLGHSMKERLSKSPFALASFDVAASLRLGKEMPEFGTIQVKGQLSARLCRLLDTHFGGFGDTHFEMEVIREQHDEEGNIVDEQRKYTWKRDGDQQPKPREENAGATMSGLHRWVPKLSPEWYTKILNVGCNVSDYEENDHIARFARRHQAEVDETLMLPDHEGQNPEADTDDNPNVDEHDVAQRHLDGKYNSSDSKRDKSEERRKSARS